MAAGVDANGQSPLEVPVMSLALHFPKLSRFERIGEPIRFAAPFAQGALRPEDAVAVLTDDAVMPTQARPTATWPDGSVKWLLVDALVDLPGNAPAEYALETGSSAPPPPVPARAEVSDGSAALHSGPLSMRLCGPGEPGLISEISLDGRTFASGEELLGPEATVGGERFAASVDEDGWQIVEPGPVRVVVEARGSHQDEGGSRLDFVARVTAWAGKPWIEVHHRLINRDAEPLTRLEALAWSLQADAGSPEAVQSAITTSNYRSQTQAAAPGETIRRAIDADHLLFTANEQVPEVLYGTFTAHWRHPERGGLSATIFQGYQNYPTALTVGPEGLRVELVAAESDGLELMRGMAKGYRFLLHLHDGSVPAEDLIVRALQYQMPDRPLLPSEAYRDAGVLPDLFVEHPVARVERKLLDLADHRTKGYGALHWGDGPERGYTDQGRGRGELVWCNHEYDLPRAAMLMLARTSERRMLDYLLVSAEHWMEVDVCHHSDDPLRHCGMICHSARHARGGVTVSHEWVEGILDYYHQTGDGFALETALGVGENVLRHLDQMMQSGVGAFSARETGWAIRTLAALYDETHEERWLRPAEQIVGHFEEWMGAHGTWLAPYTDHTLVRVPFMIAVAVNGLMCYHALRPEQRVERMVVSAVDDLVEHCLMPDGRFYYKELPSLERRGAGTLVLEALAHAWELTGDLKYLRAGMTSFELSLQEEMAGWSGAKYVDGDAVIDPKGPGPKAFAAYFMPITRFYRAAVLAGLLAEEEVSAQKGTRA